MSGSIHRQGNRIREWLIAGFLFLSVAGSYAQDYRFSLRFDSIEFRTLVDTLEKRIPYRFFYADEWSDTLILNVNSSDVTLEEFLNSNLRPAGFSFIITGDNKVILLKGFHVKTDFRDEYLGNLRPNRALSENQNFVPPAPKEKQSAISDEYRIFRIGQPASGQNATSAVLSGRVVSAGDGKGISGVIVYIEKLKMGAMTNDAGNYSVTLPRGQYRVEFRMIGMQTARRNIILSSSGTLNINMEESTSEVEAVVITGNRSNIVRDARTGIEKINIKMLKQIPMGLGEADVLKSSLLLPGVQTVGEASAGFNVRGGSTDQNLVFLNNAPIINTSHFFGFFSAFNSDLVSGVTLYKSGMPAKYGGRLSSVMDIATTEGNNEKINVSGGISPMTGRIMVEGPADRIKGTFILGARATYSDWILGLLRDYRLRNSKAGFYDLQGMIKSEVNNKNSISVSGYFSNDKFDYYREQAFDYGNLASTLKWEHTFNQRLSAQFFAILSNYRYGSDSNQDSSSFSSMRYAFNQKILRADFLYYATSRHKIEFGLDASYYSLRPGILNPVGDYSSVIPKELEKEQAAESSLYFSDDIEISPLLLVSGGFRATLFTAFGPETEFRYKDGVTRSEGSINDTVSYSRGDISNIYPGLEYRLSSRMIVTPELSFKFGMQRVYQYIHMISNTTSMSPTDIWKLSDRYIRPQRSDQISFGVYGSFGKKAVETSAEAYFKKLNNILDYKGGATLLMNEHLETDVLSGTGKAYGVELMVKKQNGTFTGWVSYTYSRILLKVDGRYGVEKVNNGEYFPADFDKPHDLKIVSNTKLSRRLNLTTNFVYNTGRPITYPIAFYSFNNSIRVYYSNRNEYRIPDYIRLDLAATINGNLKAKKLNHSSFTFTVYNALGRRNPYSIFFRTEDGEIRGYQMSIFSQPVFMASYNFRIRGNATGDF